MKVLVLGSGGREHCLAWKLSSGSDISRIYAIPGNPGIEQIGVCKNIPLTKQNFRMISEFVEEEKIDFTIVGPEAPLVDGIVDYFTIRGHSIFGPGRSASRLEGSKIFTKQLCLKYGIPTAESVKFARAQYDKAAEYIKKLDDNDLPIVIKVDGLAAGKGVLIADSREDALLELQNCFIGNIFGDAGEFIIIEKFIKGFEVSLLNLCDGKNIIPMVLAQDYKKIFDNDKGKNTGGMGSYSPVPFVGQSMYKKILEEIIYPTYEALLKEGIDYRGILYGGIIVSDGQPYLLEYNCRFGDPETQAILPMLENDLLELMIKCSDGNLGSSALKWDGSKCVCVVLASRGYPETSSKNDLIMGLDYFTDNHDSLVFHAGTRSDGSEIYTNGGRVLSVVSKAKSFKEARDRTYKAVDKISFDGMQYRKDIAKRVEEEIS